MIYVSNNSQTPVQWNAKDVDRNRAHWATLVWLFAWEPNCLFLRCSILLWAAERWSCDCRMRRQCVAKGTVKSFVLQGLDKVDESCVFVHDCSHADDAEHVNTPGVFLHMRFHSPEPVIAVAADVMFSASPSFLFLLKRYCTKRQREFRRPGKNIHLTSTMNITE